MTIEQFMERRDRTDLWDLAAVGRFLGLSRTGKQVNRLWWATQNYLLGIYVDRWPAPWNPAPPPRSCRGPEDVVRSAWPLDGGALPAPDLWEAGAPRWREGTIRVWALWVGRVDFDDERQVLHRPRVSTKPGLIADEISGRIAQGEFTTGDRLPSARTMARGGAGHKDTVFAAYRELIRRGLVVQNGQYYIVQ